MLGTVSAEEAIRQDISSSFLRVHEAESWTLGVWALDSQAQWEWQVVQEHGESESALGTLYQGADLQVRFIS